MVRNLEEDSSDYEDTHFKVGLFPSQEISLTFLARRSSLIRGQKDQRSPPNSQPQEGVQAPGSGAFYRQQTWKPHPSLLRKLRQVVRRMGGGGIHTCNIASHQQGEPQRDGDLFRGPDRHASPTINRS